MDRRREEEIRELNDTVHLRQMPNTSLRIAKSTLDPGPGTPKEHQYLPAVLFFLRSCRSPWAVPIFRTLNSKRGEDVTFRSPDRPFIFSGLAVDGHYLVVLPIGVFLSLRLPKSVLHQAKGTTRD
jgi:hypothetical protein